MHKISVYRINVQTKYKCKMLQNKDFKAMFNIAISSQDSQGKMKNVKKNLQALIDPLCAATYLGKTVQTSC